MQQQTNISMQMDRPVVYKEKQNRDWRNQSSLIADTIQIVFKYKQVRHFEIAQTIK